MCLNYKANCGSLLGSTHHFLLEYQALIKEREICRFTWCCCSSHESKVTWMCSFNNHTQTFKHDPAAFSLPQGPLWPKDVCQGGKGLPKVPREIGWWFSMAPGVRNVLCLVGVVTSTLQTWKWKCNHHYKHQHLKALPFSSLGPVRTVMN